MTAEQTGRRERRRDRRDRRTGEERRSSVGRRSSDPVGRFALIPAFWAVVGAAVVVYLFFAALGEVSYDDAPAASIAALALAVLWLIHAWRRVFVGSRSPVADRERRGF
jgi:hypothetical protein